MTTEGNLRIRRVKRLVQEYDCDGGRPRKKWVTEDILEQRIFGLWKPVPIVEDQADQ